jgi:hypothetical protein
MAFMSTARPILKSEDALVFLGIADCFCPRATKRWPERFGPEGWPSFVASAKDLLRRFEAAGIGSLELVAPPTHCEHSAFASFHLVPGKTWALIPKERAYRWKSGRADAQPAQQGREAGEAAAASSLAWLEAAGTRCAAGSPAAAQTSAAAHMPAPANCTGQAGRPDITREASRASVLAYFARSYDVSDDHLSVMLTYLAFLVHNKLFAEAHRYIAEHFEWLPAYRSDLLSAAPHACFYAVLLDLVIRISAAPMQKLYCGSCR